MSLRAHGTVRARGVEFACTLPSGHTLAVIGPNGSGKSTLLAALAGTILPDEGEAVLDGATLYRMGSAIRPGRRRVLLAPHRRQVAVLGQDAALFPHQRVLGNVAFAAASTGLRGGAARAAAMRWLERVGVQDLASRYPASLSGGQAQRVALARALAAEPSLILLDEPLSALDVTVAPTLRDTLRDQLTGRSAIIVTHDLADVYGMADAVLVMVEGRVVDGGRVRRPDATAADDPDALDASRDGQRESTLSGEPQVFETPQHAFTAEFAGRALLRGVAMPGALRTARGTIPAIHSLPEGAPALAAPRWSELRVVRAGDPVRTGTFARFDAEHNADGDHGVRPSNEGVGLAATVESIEYPSGSVRIRTDIASADTPASSPLHRGDRVRVVPDGPVRAYGVTRPRST